MRKVVIIAEAGVNHNGDLQIAKKLIDAGADAGVDFVKFQTFKARNIVSQSAPTADYQKKNGVDSKKGQYDMLKALELPYEAHIELIEYCNSKNVKFFSTAFDVESLDFLHSLGFSQFKVPSGEITNYPYLRRLGSYQKEVILSTGMSELYEVSQAIDLLVKSGTCREKITVLHCNTEYPTPMKDVNLKAMLTIGEKLNVKVGYSDHTLGIEVPTAAVALGACIIEKHFTLDRSMEGPDQIASLEPDELKAMVCSIRNIELATSGNGQKTPSLSEQKNISIARKSIHLVKNASKGEVLTEEHLIPLRPGDGISPMEWDKVLGRVLNQDLSLGEKLEWHHLVEN